ncbi:unnamed protein product [Prorocentrum cordatum]|uniref:Uncharacterized protein n=1 Tax=Prorocentrum cordatum TaxID=2364126 RepID=A0ABN9TJX8_9DINO|nr:unnamed protein product [Polarella glacialis]
MENGLLAKGVGMFVDIEERITRALNQVICNSVSCQNPFFYSWDPCDVADLAHPNPEGVLRFEISQQDASQPVHIAFGGEEAKTCTHGEFLVWDSGRQHLRITATHNATDMCMVVPLAEVAQSGRRFTYRNMGQFLITQSTKQEEAQSAKHSEPDLYQSPDSDELGPGLSLVCQFRKFSRHTPDDADAIGTALESQPVKPWVVGKPSGPVWMLRVDIYHATGLLYKEEFTAYELSVSTDPPARLVVGRGDWHCTDPAPPIRHLLEALSRDGEGSASKLKNQCCRADLPQGACFEERETQQAARVICGEQGAQRLLEEAVTLHQALPLEGDGCRIRDAVWNETVAFLFESDGPLTASIARAQLEITVQARKNQGGPEALGSLKRKCVDLMKEPYGETVCEKLSDAQGHLRARLQLHPFVGCPRSLDVVDESTGPPGASLGPWSALLGPLVPSGADSARGEDSAQGAQAPRETPGGGDDSPYADAVSENSL